MDPLPITKGDFEAQFEQTSDRSDDDLPGGGPGSDDDIDEFLAGDAAEPVAEEQYTIDEADNLANVFSRRARRGAQQMVRLEGAARMSEPVMSRFEYAGVIGERATQIEQGAQVDQAIRDKIVELRRTYGDKTLLTQALDIAHFELEMTSVPFPMVVERRLAPNVYEIWRVRELRLPSQVLCEGYSPESTALLRVILREQCPPDATLAFSRNLKKFTLAR